MPLEYLASAFVTLLIVMNPPGLGPIFIGLTNGVEDRDRSGIAFRACLIAAGILIFFAFLGEGLLKLVGIGVPAFRIAGGLLLFSIAYEMLFDRRSQRQGSVAQTALTADQARNIAAFPLAIPLMAGPGAITATILLASSARPSPVSFAGLIAMILAVVAICYAVFRAAGPLSNALGVTGNTVLQRLLGVLLSAMAVQFVVDGVLALR